MSDIKFVRKHALTVAQAKKIAQKAADDLAEEYDLESDWEGDTLNFARSGVNGAMDVTANEIKLEVETGSPLGPKTSERSDELRSGTGRQPHDRTCRRAHRLAVEVDGKSLGRLRHIHAAVEALHRRRLHLDLRAAGRVRIGQQFPLFEVAQDFAHRNLLRCLLARRPVDDDQPGGNQRQRREYAP